MTPSSNVTRELNQLPEPKVRNAVAVYGFRDQTGQFKSYPDSAYSTMVTQGAATMLVKALKDSGWYIPVEREGLQNLLTERRIVRAIEAPSDKGKPVVNLPNLTPASLIIEGGVVGYETNVRTGGKGANYLGIGADTQYRVDQVTVGLRSVDIRSGQVLNTSSVTKTIYSYHFSASVYKFVAYHKLLQGETGFTTNEPAQLAVREALESAVIHLTVQGVRDRHLELKNEQDWYHPVFQAYLNESVTNLSEEEIGEEEPVPRPPVRPTIRPRPVRPLLSSEADGAAARTEAVAGVVQAPIAAANAPAGAAAPASSGPAPAASASPLPTVPSVAPAAPVAPVARTPDSASTAGSAVRPEERPSDKPAPRQPSPSDDIFRLYWHGQHP